jgi:hypothetical protein
VNTRDRAHRLLDELPASEVEPVVEFIVSRREGKQVVDEWGDLDAWSDAVCRSTFRELDEEEAKIGFSWERYRHP